VHVVVDSNDQPVIRDRPRDRVSYVVTYAGSGRYGD